MRALTSGSSGSRFILVFSVSSLTINLLIVTLYLLVLLFTLLSIIVVCDCLHGNKLDGYIIVHYDMSH